MRMATPPNLLIPSDGERGPAIPPNVNRIRRRLLRILRAAAISAAVLFVVLAWTTRSSNPNVLRSLRDSGAVRSVLTFLRSPSGALQGERRDRVAILLLGVGGDGHEGPQLADTILLAVLQPRSRHAALISIPRDLLLPLPDSRSEKANAVHAYAEAASPGAGGDAIRAALADAVGVEIPYHLRIDFTGFARFIDELGGVDVDVERTLDDPEYPITGRESAPWSERFERLIIPAGRQHMDGVLALKYVRSRHGRAGEGSDFARARRQQRLLLAIRDRVRSRAVLANPRRLLALRASWRDHVDTNLSPSELYRLAGLAQRLTDAEVSRVVLDDAPNGLLTAGRWNGAFVLRPRDGTFEQVRGVVRDALAVATTAPAARPATLVAEVWNGTPVTGLAARIAADLARDGVAVAAIRNAPTARVNRTVIYYRPTVPSELLARLTAELRAETSTAFPAVGTAAPVVDLLIVLGNAT